MYPKGQFNPRRFSHPGTVFPPKFKDLISSELDDSDWAAELGNEAESLLFHLLERNSLPAKSIVAVLNLSLGQTSL